MPEIIRCPRCRTALVSGLCPSCPATHPAGATSSAGDDIDEAKRRLEETRERLGAWRERLSKRLDDFQKKRDVLSGLEARRAARAPTARLEPLAGSAADARPFPPDSEQRASADESHAETTALASAAANAGEAEPFAAAPEPFAAAPEPFAAAPEPFAATPEPFAATPEPFAAAPEPFAATPEPDGVASSDAGEAMSFQPSPLDITRRVTASEVDRALAGSPPDPDPPIAPAAAAVRAATPEPRPGIAPAPAPVRTPTPRPAPPPTRAGGGHGLFDDLDGRRPAPAAAPAESVPSPRVATALPPPHPATARGSNDGSSGLDAAPSLVRRTAALVLDLLLLLVLPAAVLTLPAARFALNASVAAVWSYHADKLVPLVLIVFVLLQTAYLGAFGRTPGLRATGLRVVDETGQSPSFALALLRAVIFPLAIVPALESASRIRTVNEP